MAKWGLGAIPSCRLRGVPVENVIDFSWYLHCDEGSERKIDPSSWSVALMASLSMAGAPRIFQMNAQWGLKGGRKPAPPSSAQASAGSAEKKLPQKERTAPFPSRGSPRSPCWTQRPSTRGLFRHQKFWQSYKISGPRYEGKVLACT